MGSYSTHCVQEVSFSCGLFQDLPQQTEASTIHHKAGSQGRTVVLIAHLSAKPMTAGVALSSAISGMKGWGCGVLTWKPRSVQASVQGLGRRPRPPLGTRDRPSVTGMNLGWHTRHPVSPHCSYTVLGWGHSGFLYSHVPTGYWLVQGTRFPTNAPRWGLIAFLIFTELFSSAEALSPPNSTCEA